MNVSDLNPAEYNPRRISEEQMDRLEKSMLEFGDLSGIVVNVRSGHIVGGHQRVKTLSPNLEIKKKAAVDSTGTVALGLIETPTGSWQYREVDWSEKKELAANLAANKHGGSFDIPKLKDILIEIDDGAFDLDLTGFSVDEFRGFIDFDGLKIDPEESTEVAGKSRQCPECGASI